MPLPWEAEEKSDQRLLDWASEQHFLDWLSPKSQKRERVIDIVVSMLDYLVGTLEN